jgi:hypothetical protein
MAYLNNALDPGELNPRSGQRYRRSKVRVMEQREPCHHALSACIIHRAWTIDQDRCTADYWRGRRKEDLFMNARNLIHLAERIYVITMPTTGHGSSVTASMMKKRLWSNRATSSYKGCDGPHASGTYILTFEADTPKRNS